MMTKRLSEVTRKNSADKAAQFMDTLMPTMGETPPAADTPTPPLDVPAAEPEPVAAAAATPPTAPKNERNRKGPAFSLDDIVGPTPKDGEAFNKMVRVSDEHHELLRTLAFKYRKNMNVFVHNLMELLNQAYTKDQQKDA